MNPRPLTTVSRLAILLAFMAGSLSLAFVLPKGSVAREAAIRMTLPEDFSFWGVAGLGGDSFQYWKGRPLAVSEAEHALLADDTEFEKKSYLMVEPSGGQPLIHELHGLQASIVMSGHDLNDSIHRPERCLPSQGFKQVRGEGKVIKTSQGDLHVTRLRCYSEVPDPKTGKLATGPDGKALRIEHVFYYWFVGNSQMTANHYERTFIDMKGRLFGGYDQRWAYVLLGAPITDGLAAAGIRLDTAYPAGRTEAQSDAALEALVKEISEKTLVWDRVAQ